MSGHSPVHLQKFTIIKNANVDTPTPATRTLNHSASHNTAEHPSATFLHHYKMALE
jgi:hypothetical protein